MRYFIFEIRHWLRQPMTWVFLAINTLLIFGATSSDSIQVGGSFGNVFKNAPFVIQNYYSVMSIITLLMTTAFVSASTLRDFSYNTHQIIFSSPVARMQYLVGRFLGAVVASLIPLLGISLGIIIGCAMPWVDAERIGPFILDAHLHGIFFIGLPNTLFTGSVVFLVAALSRNSMTSFISSLVLLVLTVVAGEVADDLDKEWLSVLMDPYGASTYSILTKYWTVSDKNTLVLPLSGLYLMNRIIWMGIGLCITWITASRFSFSERIIKSKRKSAEIPLEEKPVQPLPLIVPEFGKKSLRKLFAGETIRELKDILKSPAFIVIMLAGLLNFVPGLFLRKGAYGLTSHPVTWWMINSIQGSFYSFLVAIITIYSGQLVWKERDNRMDEIYDATPHPTWVTFLSKFSAVGLLIFFVQLMLILFCVTAQLSKGFTDIRLGVYFTHLILIDFSGLLLLVLLSMWLHTVINNKYIAFFAFVAFLLLNSFIWGVMDIESNMVSYGGRPEFTYSDMNGFGPFLRGIFWFRVYWYLFAILLGIFTLLLWTRGREFNFKSKKAAIKSRFTPALKRWTLVIAGLWIVCGGFVFYNTKILNKIETSDAREKRQADYEKTYKKYEGIPQPRITDVKYKIDLFPEGRKLNVHSELWMKNKSDIAIDSVHFTLPEGFEVKINLRDSKLVLNDKRLNYRIYKLAHPMLPGDSLKFEFSADFIAKGFENEVAYTSVVDNGSFFNNLDFSPMIGYQQGAELSGRDERKDQKLPPAERMPKLERNCTSSCMNNYLTNHADWVNVETLFSTDSSQVAVAPGSLIKKWNENGRSYYHFKLEQKSLYFYSFISARYQVLREKHNGIDVEVYYDKKHRYNVDKMARSMKRSLDYYTAHFGPYYHKQVRIIEFPRYASFAQAFPGTMPYSEAIGFIAKIESKEDIDMVFYVVAHEMAHQYWAHQVIGANMQGATVLSESFAQYSALMVMEKEYGKDKMKKFMEYEMDNYLNRRGSEELKEMPLMLVENQGYIHYRKASLVLYYLREMIGEDHMNAALKSLIDEYAYKEPPYPTVYAAIDAIRAQTPDSLQYLIKDLFETITVFNNRAVSATVEKLGNERYNVTLNYECNKYRADSLGKQTAIPVSDWIEVGVYAKPEGDAEIGKKLYLGLHHITASKGKITVMVPALPYQAGIDPRNLLVDLVGDDNLVKIE
ncbi:MAG TPA: M1 family aminopeptidase [Bacteroidia bacterium]|nr:M1 family aminopeptidase [Bacteroidia bacterium]